MEKGKAPLSRIEVKPLRQHQGNTLGYLLEYHYTHRSIKRCLVKTGSRLGNGTTRTDLGVSQNRVEVGHIRFYPVFSLRTGKDALYLTRYFPLRL